MIKDKQPFRCTLDQILNLRLGPNQNSKYEVIIMKGFQDSFMSCFNIMTLLQKCKDKEPLNQILCPVLDSILNPNLDS